MALTDLHRPGEYPVGTQLESSECPRMTWPLSQDYNEAIQDPQTSLADPELRAGVATVNALGMPLPRSGTFADVYEMNCPSTGRKWAVKCFTRHVPGLRERYSEISRTLQAANLPFVVGFKYLEQGIRVRDQWYPILKMRWVAGLLLNEFVRNNLDKPWLLGQLSIIWGRMARRLRAAGIAHCDLQHSNVLLVPGSKTASLALKLIDYDGMFVPSLAQSRSGEVGHPNYQHPQRLREGSYSLEVDRFPLLVVATTLQALSVGGPLLWERYDNGDNLLFKESDLRQPAESTLFKELLDYPDPRTQQLVGGLWRACEGSLEETPGIDELLSDPRLARGRPAGTPPPLPVPVAAVASPPPLPNTALDFDTAAGSEWDFDVVPLTRSSADGSRRRRRKTGPVMAKWIWLALCAAVLAFASSALLALALGFQGKRKK